MLWMKGTGIVIWFRLNYWFLWLAVVLGMVFKVYIQDGMKFYHKFVGMVFYILYGLKIFDKLFYGWYSTKYAGSRDDILRTERLKSLCLVVLGMVFTYCMVWNHWLVNIKIVFYTWMVWSSMMVLRGMLLIVLDGLKVYDWLF